MSRALKKAKITCEVSALNLESTQAGNKSLAGFFIVHIFISVYK
jgi:hypothetical protein